MIVSRVGTFAAFASVYHNEFFVFLLCHWILMVIWTLMMRTNFCGSGDDKPRPISEFIYNVVMAFVLIFDVVHLKDGPTRLKHLLFYTITFIEDAVLVAVWYDEVGKEVRYTLFSNGRYFSDRNSFQTVPTPGHFDWNHEEAVTMSVLITIPVSFVLSLIFLMVYYRWFHPEGNMPDKKQKASFI